jgi:AP-4 complex subunit mu-1
MISQFFVLSTRGDTIINRDFRSDLIKNTPEVFFRNVKLWKGDAPPIFNIDGISYAYLKKSSLYIVVTTRSNVAPSFIMEVLNRVSKVIKDFCGVLTEEAIRKNFVLIYEILDESLDFGYPQLTSTELIKSFIVNEPVAVESAKALPFRPSIFTQNTISSVAVQRPIQTKAKENKKNEIFVDIFEKITVLFNASGYVINSGIEGCIQMKSYLQGNPPLKLALNDELVIGRGTSQTGVILDDCNFHECVNTSEFEMSKVLRIKPPDGEFTVMNYRVTSDFQAPFRIFPFIDEVSNTKLELVLKVRAAYPKETYASHAILKFPVPKLTSNVYTELEKGVQAQKADYNSTDKTVEWIIKKFQGGVEHTLRTKITLQTNANTYAARKEIGPIKMTFEIPMYNLSNLQIKYLRIEEKEKSTNPFRWVRYVTQSSNYVCRT